MWRDHTPRAAADTLRLLAVAVLVAAQFVVAGRCAACDAGECAACVAGDGDATALPATAACPLCAAADDVTGGEPHESAPCGCQWQPRDEVPVTMPSRVAVDPPAAAPGTFTASDDQRGPALVGRLPVVTDIPQRPVRILLGVWRN